MTDGDRDNKGRFAKGNKYRITSADAARRGRKGANVTNSRAVGYKTLRDAAIEIGEMMAARDKEGNVKTYTEVATKKMYDEATKGNVQAYNTIMKLRGEDVTKVQVEAPPASVIEFGEEIDE